jgi:antitoxin component of RelBE/YafQ-DinJ toxin-antitoxin module
MKRALQFIKTYAISLLCGVFAVGAIVVCVLGMTSDAVVKEMKKKVADTGASNIKRLSGKPQNEETISTEKQRGELFEAEYRKTVEAAKAINERQVLMDDVFPVADRVTLQVKFQEKYANTMRVLYTQIDAGKLPTEAEIQEEAQNVEALQLLEEEQRAEEESSESGRAPAARPTGRSPGRTVGRTATPRARGMPPTGSGRRMAPVGRSMPSAGRGGPMVSTIRAGGEPKYDPVYRARVAKARSILCYYDENTFHISPLVLEDAAPPPEDMWFAQVGLWVQEDVVNAIAGLNRAAADLVTDTDPCVQNVPVKRLVFVRVLGYETPLQDDRERSGGRIWFPGAEAGVSLGGIGGPSLTGRECDEQFDVVRFVVSVMIDQRDLQQLIDRISRVNFYQCLSVHYDKADHESEIAVGYFYGTDPVVAATLEFEGYMAREVYQPLMPEAVLELLGITKSDG